MNTTKNSLSQKHATLGVMALIFCMSFFVSSSYRGIAHDEGIGGFRAGAMRILARQPILSGADIESGTDAVKLPARLIYLIFIAIGCKIFGINLVAFHIFPYLLQIINPCLFFLVAYRLYKKMWWGFAGALLFIFHPFNFVYLNQQHTHPIFVFFLLILLLLLDSSVRNPKLLVILGAVSSLLLLTRFTGGVIFVTMIYTVYIVNRWSRGIPLKWLLLSLGALLITYSVFALYFGFPVLFPFYYFPSLLQRSEAFEGSISLSFYQATMQAFRNILNWYFCGKLIAPFLVLLVFIGAITQIRQRVFLPIALYLPHFLFISLVFPGRVDAGWLEPLTFSVPGFILMLLSGIQTIHHVLFSGTLRIKRNVANVTRAIQFPFLQKLLVPVVMIILLGFFGRSAYSLAIVAEDSHPASTMWRIVKNNPPLPGNPLYKEPYIQLNREERLPVKLREEVYKTVRGSYRSWYIHRVGQYAFEQDLPEQAGSHADFFYVDDYEAKDKWETDRYHIEGTSPLWNDEFPGRIGAFPFGKGGSFVYKFDFSSPIDDVIISDIHTQWGFGDVTKMWTSTDGEHWTLRYYNWNVHYSKDYYYQFFEEEFDGQRSLFVKYYFFAGDKTRTSNDNRGSGLEEFSLAVKYKER